MVRIITFSIGFIFKIIEIVFSILGLIAAILGAGVALALCVAVLGGLAIIVSFLLVLFG